jgi:hypothetical protein
LINKYKGNLDNIAISKSTSFGTLLTFEEFELLFVKSKKKIEMKNQHITRDNLIDLYYISSCEEWQNKIDNLLESCKFQKGEFNVEIPQEYLNFLIKKGTTEQKKAVEDFGIKLEVDNSVSINISQKALFSEDGGSLLQPRNYGEYKGKAFSLNKSYNWEIKVDEQNFLCLIPTKK